MRVLSSSTLGRGPRLVLIPGWAMHSGVWREFAERLAANFCVTWVDLPGHGLSPAWAEWTLVATAEALAELIPDRALWLGWSLGGQVALELARRYPAKVAALVLVATNPRFIAESDWPGMAPAMFESFALGVETQSQATMHRFLALNCLGAAGAMGLLRRLRTAWESYPAPAPTVLGQGLEILRQTDLRQELAEIGCPVAVVAGSEDRLVPAAAARRLAAGLPRAQLAILEGAGHAPFLSHAEELAALAWRLAA